MTSSFDGYVHIPRHGCGVLYKGCAPECERRWYKLGVDHWRSEVFVSAQHLGAPDCNCIACAIERGRDDS